MIIHNNNKDSNKCINSYYFIILTKEICFALDCIRTMVFVEYRPFRDTYYKNFNTFFINIITNNTNRDYYYDQIY